MTKLEKLYASIKGLQDLSLPLNTETLKAADNFFFFGGDNSSRRKSYPPYRMT